MWWSGCLLLSIEFMLCCSLILICGGDSIRENDSKYCTWDVINYIMKYFSFNSGINPWYIIIKPLNEIIPDQNITTITPVPLNLHCSARWILYVWQKGIAFPREYPARTLSRTEAEAVKRIAIHCGRGVISISDSGYTWQQHLHHFHSRAQKRAMQTGAHLEPQSKRRYECEWKREGNNY